MPLDPELAPIVTLMNAGTASEPAEPSVTEMRQGMLALAMALGEAEEVGAVEDRAVPGPAGDIPVRIYRPPGDGPTGGLVYYHGGGFVLGDLTTHDHLCRELTNRSGAVVVAVDYRRAPEHRYPAAVDDAWAALGWVADHADELGIAPGALAVGGDSAGGNLAAVIARRARDAGGPALALQLLVYPVADLHDAGRWPSRTTNGEGYVLTRQMMDWFHDQYLGGPPEPGDADVSPVVATDLSGLPPAYVVLAELDPLHDEGQAYAQRLAEAGVAVEVDDVPGAVHIFFQLGPLTSIGRGAVDRAAQAVVAAFAEHALG